MVWLFLALIVLACVILSVLVLVQNSKGGGLAGSFSGFSNQIMGVKKTTDVLENGTWLFAVIIALLCLSSGLFINKKADANGRNVGNMGSNTPAQQAPAR
ncbi:preprotein translocase subunit SecG [Dinghuibacter silviterrae]|uniref:Protein-export membrane protein SecG n=1 Tax=Dinghuibacter silviterrae TaxID=1539049 RepID=A0A4R8DIH8_9BACT|nr:preprotein translocase subunit SecG [Dinghuibacter silviterrae]TDW97367.1 preprotein translocase subunit SecG [Dinghuibacter silviterrae]